MSPPLPFHFALYLRRWHLAPDGPPIVTHCSNLLPVRYGGMPAMLRVAHEPDNQTSGVLMRWWDGGGAAHVLAGDGDALVLERAEGTRSLSTMVRAGADDEAARIICAVAAQLHAPRAKPLPDLIPLDHWFDALPRVASNHGGILVTSAAAARQLLAAPRDISPLHGDLHHDNVLDFGPERGWLAIDPNRLLGERGFDFANIFCNPERDVALVTSRARVLQLADVIAEAAGHDRHRLLQWLLAYAGLSASWIIEDGNEPALELAVAEVAAAELA